MKRGPNVSGEVLQGTKPAPPATPISGDEDIQGAIKNAVASGAQPRLRIKRKNRGSQPL